MDSDLCENIMNKCHDLGGFQIERKVDRIFGISGRSICYTKIKCAWNLNALNPYNMCMLINIYAWYCPLALSAIRKEKSSFLFPPPTGWCVLVTVTDYLKMEARSRFLGSLKRLVRKIVPTKRYASCVIGHSGQCVFEIALSVAVQNHLLFLVIHIAHRCLLSSQENSNRDSDAFFWDEPYFRRGAQYAMLDLLGSPCLPFYGN